MRSWAGHSLISALTKCGQRSNLQLCLDAGDANSYDGSSQSWLDTSGNGYDFFRGTTSGATAADPTFNGSSGGMSSSEYFSFDGGDNFRYDSANEAWMQNLHKNNALFTLMGWIYQPAGTFSGLAGTCATGTTGFRWRIRSSNDFLFAVLNAGATVVSVAGGSVTTNQWTFVALSVDEANGTGFFQNEDNSSSFTSTYSSPAAGNATATLELAAEGNQNQLYNTGGRMAMFAAWEGRALSSEELNAIYMATRGRFGV